MAKHETKETPATSTQESDAAHAGTQSGTSASTFASSPAPASTASATTAPAPVNVLATQNEQNPPQFSFEVSRTPTNRIQYATNREASATISALGMGVLRGEVIDVTAREKAAAGLVENGSFAYVSNDTPLGQPDEFKPKPREKKTTDTSATSGTGTEK